MRYGIHRVVSLCAIRREAFRKHKSKSIGHDGKFYGKRAGRFAIELRKNLYAVNRAARKSLSLPHLDSFHAMKTAHPNCRQAGEYAEAAPSSVGNNLTLIFKEARADSDAKWPSVVLRASDYDQARIQSSFRRLDRKQRKRIREKLAKSFEPVRKNADARLIGKIDAVNDGSVGPGAAHAQKITLRRNRSALFFGGAPPRQAQRDARELAACDQACCSGNVPRNTKLLRKDIRRSSGQYSQRRIRASDAVHYFVDRSIAAANYDHAAIVLSRIARQFRRRAHSCRGKQPSIDSRSLKNARRFFDLAQTARAVAPARGIVNNHRVANLFRYGP